MDFFIKWKNVMDKNGQKRGGKRSGAGRPKKSNSDIQIIKLNQTEDTGLKAFMETPQKGGTELVATKVYEEMKKWLKKANVDKNVPDQLLILYAMSFARWVQMEERLSKQGFQTKHPTTGQYMASQFIRVSMEYAKQTSAAWQQIANIIKDHTSDKSLTEEPTNSLLDALRQRREA